MAPAGRPAQSADYVVVGAGSAGAVLAARLSEEPGRTVLLLEAGGWDDRPEIHRVDAAAAFALLGSEWSQEIDWGYRTEPGAGVADRAIPVARGKVVGGCSSVNALMWVRGNRADYDAWAAAGNPGWSYDELLPYFRRSEAYDGGASELRGALGPIGVTRHHSPTPLARAFVAAAAELGQQAADTDYNGEVQDGYGFLYQTTQTRTGRRSSTATGYLHPSVNRTNLTVAVGARATRVLLSGDRAVGVEYVQDGELRRAEAGAEVILAAGAFESPKLLMLSGIGPADELRRHGIAPVRDLPGVGGNLQDHLFVPVCFQSAVEHPDGAMISEAGLFTRTGLQPEVDSPDLQFTFGPIKFLPPDAPAGQWEGPGFTFAPIGLLPHSRGRVSLRDGDPASRAVVRAGYLEDGRDLDVLVEGVGIARELARTRAFDDFRGDELSPGKEAQTTAEVRAYVRANATTLWHPVGTCRMGTDPDAVVDHRLRVHGVDGLRVADASVMPRIVAGNTNAPTIMIGEKAAALVAGTSDTGSGDLR